MNPGRYNFENIMKVMHDPSYIYDELCNFATPIRRRTNKHYLRYQYESVFDVMEQDWDNLLILDACRYDIFSEVNTIGGQLSKVLMPSSTSHEFINYYFNDGEFHDTVYVSANPHSTVTLNNNVFHDLVNTYDGLEKRKIDSLYPETVSERAIETYGKYPKKRIIIHFMQPHQPFIGDLAKEIKVELIESENIFIKNSEYFGENPSNQKYDEVYKRFEDAANDGYLTDIEMRNMYKENLEIVLEEVKKLIGIFDGKTVITADHGELLGNPTSILPIKEKYGHHAKLNLPELRVVPWLTVNSETRRQTTSDPPQSNNQFEQKTAESQLEALGYKS